MFYCHLDINFVREDQLASSSNKDRHNLDPRAQTSGFTRAAEIRGGVGGFRRVEIRKCGQNKEYQKEA